MTVASSGCHQASETAPNASRIGLVIKLELRGQRAHDESGHVLERCGNEPNTPRRPRKQLTICGMVPRSRQTSRRGGSNAGGIVRVWRVRLNQRKCAHGTRVGYCSKQQHFASEDV